MFSIRFFFAGLWKYLFNVAAWYFSKVDASRRKDHTGWLGGQSCFWRCLEGDIDRAQWWTEVRKNTKSSPPLPTCHPLPLPHPENVTSLKGMSDNQTSHTRKQGQTTAENILNEISMFRMSSVKLCSVCASGVKTYMPRGSWLEGI